MRFNNYLYSIGLQSCSMERLREQYNTILRNSGFLPPPPIGLSVVGDGYLYWNAFWTLAIYLFRKIVDLYSNDSFEIYKSSQQKY